MIVRCLQAIKASDYPVREILFFDDGSSDGSGAAAAREGVRVLRNDGRPLGPAAGRNRAAAQAQGELLLFVDSDVVIRPDTIGLLVGALDDGAAAAFGSYDDNPPAPQSVIALYSFASRALRMTSCTCFSCIGCPICTELPAISLVLVSISMLEKVAPKVESVAADIADMAQSAREQTAHIRFTADEVLARVYRQTSRVDNMITNVADGVEHASSVVADSVTRPVRQASAMLAAAKAFLGVLATGRRRDRQEVVTDQDMFV